MNWVFNDKCKSLKFMQMQKQGGERKTVAGKYIVYMSQELGRGTFAATYICRLKNDLSHILACKLMNKKQISSMIDDIDYLVQRVKDEASSWKELSHPNIVRFQGCEETLNNIYFFLEFCPDGTLDSYISKHRFSVNVSEIIAFSKQLISACAYLESKNIVHRDIKPSNILLKGNCIKLADFGLARAIKTNDEEHLKSFFTFAGTLHYMAPEIIKCEKHPYKCDVWSVGVTIFVMFTGDLPFGMTTKDNSQKVILEKIQVNRQQFEHPIFRNSSEIVSILKQMLSPDAKERPNMSQVMALMEKI